MDAARRNAHLFDEHYFRHGCGRPYERTSEWLQFFAGIADKIAREIGPRAVLDAGCALGLLVEALRDRGVEAFGVDISEYAIGQVRDDLKPYCWVGSLLEPLPRRYDLIVCIEVLEHLSAQDGETALDQLCRASDDILFSSSPLDYKEVTHFNVQPPEYWAERFALRGFVRDVDFDAGFITPWAVRFRRNHEPVHRVLRDYERRFWLLWKENVELRGLTVEMRQKVAAGERAQQQLLDITSSPSWSLLQSMRRLRLRLAPRGSARHRTLDWIVNAVRGKEAGQD